MAAQQQSATRAARTPSPGIGGATPDELTRELAAEDTAASRAHQAAMTAP